MEVQFHARFLNQSDGQWCFMVTLNLAERNFLELGGVIFCTRYSNLKWSTVKISWETEEVYKTTMSKAQAEQLAFLLADLANSSTRVAVHHLISRKDHNPTFFPPLL